MTLRRGDDVRISFSTWGGGAFHDSPEQDVSVYVDMTTVPVWRGREVSMVDLDLDLDVVLLCDGSLFVDDEDQFDEHRAGGREPVATVGARWPREFRAAS